MNWHTNIDWNGDGKCDVWDDALETTFVMGMMDDMDREERISRMVDEIKYDGSPTIDNAIFERLCNKLGYNMNDFNQSDIDEIQRRL